MFLSLLPIFILSQMLFFFVPFVFFCPGCNFLFCPDNWLLTSCVGTYKLCRKEPGHQKTQNQEQFVGDGNMKLAPEFNSRRNSSSSRMEKLEPGPRFLSVPPRCREVTLPLRPRQSSSYVAVKSMLGHHWAACTQAGVLNRRCFAVENILARICREAQR